MQLSTRAALAMLALALLSTTIVGLATYRTIERVTVAQARERVESHLGTLADALEAHLGGARSDVLAARASPLLDATIRAFNDSDSDAYGAPWRGHLAERFAAQLRAKPAYRKIQLIGTANGGQALLSVDRVAGSGAIRTLGDDELLGEDGRGRFQDVLRTPLGDVHLSKVELDRVHGQIETPRVPVIEVATPIDGPDGRASGALVIGVDMRPIFDRIRASALPGGRIYVVDERGEYLVHPDPGREFASDFGQSARLGEDFPALATTTQTHKRGAPYVGLQQSGFRPVADRTGAQFRLAGRSVPLTDDRTITLIDALPDSAVAAPVLAARRAIVDAALLTCLPAIALAVVFARSLTRPLLQMTSAVQSLARNKGFSLPTRAAGEIGVLARAFEQMAAEIKARVATIARYDQRERYYVAAVESSTQAFITTQLDGTITAWSRGAERLFEYTAEETIGRSILLIAPEDRHSEVLVNLANIRDGVTLDNWRTIRTSKSGKQIHVCVSVTPIKDQSGCPIGASAILHDITTQTLAEEKFRLAVEACPNGMVMVDGARQIVLVNGEIERLFGYDRAELIGQPIDLLVTDALDGQQAVHHQKFVVEAQAREMELGRDLMGRRKDGTEFPIEMGLNPIRTEEGLLVLSVIDITERQQAQEMFQLAVEACPSGMMMIDGYGTIVMANREIERLFGYSRGELIARSVDMLVPQQLRQQHRQFREDYTAWPETRSMGTARDLMGLRKDGTEFAVEVGLNPIHIKEDLMVLCVVQDISARKRAERLKDEFVATVSHELRTPLTSIAASLGLLAGNSAITLPEPIKRLVTIANTNSQRLVRLINDILDIEKIESGEVIFNFKRIEVRSLVEQAIDASRGLAESHNVGLRLDEESVAADVNVDADRLTQVVVNLLSNAIKFSPSGTEVVVSTTHKDGIVRVSVRDHGSGIPADFRARIFEKFAQADASDARQKGGTGLGLSIVKQIVARLEGVAGFSDAPGGGTIFHVDLPDWDSAMGADGRGEAEGDGTRVLVCDDYPALANMLATKLAKVGFESDIALSGADVISKATARRYAAILIDLQLPDCDGLSLIRELRAQPQNRDTPIIVVSSDVNRGRDDLRAAGLHVLDWFQKPVDIDRLARLLQRPRPHGGARRQHILHLDDDPEVLRAVAEAMASTADVASVATLDAAREAIAASHFDLAVVDMELSAGAGLELLPELRDRDGNPIPVIVFSGATTSSACAAQIREALSKNVDSIQGLVATLRKHIGRPGYQPAKDKGVA